MSLSISSTIQPNNVITMNIDKLYLIDILINSIIFTWLFFLNSKGNPSSIILHQFNPNWMLVV